MVEKFLYDVENGKFIEGKKFGTVGKISFRRLAETLEASGEVMKGEKITHFELTDWGLAYHVEIAR